MRLPPGVKIPFSWVRVRGNRAYVSGHGPLHADGSPAGPFGKVPTEVSLEQAQESTLLATLAILSSLKATLGDLDRVTAWLMVNGFVNAEPGYPQTTAVLNPLSDLIVGPVRRGGGPPRAHRNRRRSGAFEPAGRCRCGGRNFLAGMSLAAS